MPVWSDLAVGELLGGISQILGTPAPLAPVGDGGGPAPLSPPVPHSPVGPRSHLTDEEQAVLKYMGIDPDTARIDQINEVLRKLGKAPLGGPGPAATHPSLTNPPPPAGAPLPGQTPPLPGVTPPDGLSGAAADAAEKLSDALEHNRTALNTADEQLADALLKAQSSSDDGRARLTQLQQSIIDEVTKLGPTLDTPAGQQQLATFLQGKTADVSDILKNAQLDSASHAAVLDGLTARLTALGEKPTGSDQATPSAPGGDQNNPASPASGTSPAAAGDAAAPGAAGTAASGLGSDPLLNGLPSDALMNGLGALTGPAMGALGGLPSALGSMMPFGGAMSGGLPLGDIGSAIGSALHDPTGSPRDTIERDRNATDQGKDPTADGSTTDGASKDVTDKHDTGNEQSADRAEQAGATTEAGPAAAAGTGQVNPAAAVPPPAPDTTVKLPNGDTRTAASPQLANAVRGVLNGDNVNESYAENGLPLTPPGTPVNDPVSPSKLQFGDTGQFTDHRVVAMGDGKVWNNGQIVPLHDLDTGPTFLGWERAPQPTQAPPAATTTGTASVPAASHSEQRLAQN